MISAIDGCRACPSHIQLAAVPGRRAVRGAPLKQVLHPWVRARFAKLHGPGYRTSPVDQPVLGRKTPDLIRLSGSRSHKALSRPARRQRRPTMNREPAHRSTGTGTAQAPSGTARRTVGAGL